MKLLSAFAISTCVIIIFKVAYAGFLTSLFLGKKEEKVDTSENQWENGKGNNGMDLPKDVENSPFEVMDPTDKFLMEASKYTGQELSELDFCQQKAILEIQTTCADLNEEEIAKLSVQLLNCQSSIEGRATYKCSADMRIGECTQDMDSETWNAYHIMSNRARSVCYAARQYVFRMRAESTVNKLIYTAQNQIDHLEKLKEGQEDLMQATEKGQEHILRQQDSVINTQSMIHRTISSNAQQLLRERALIAAGQKDIADKAGVLKVGLESLRSKLETANNELKEQREERREGHEEVMKDLLQLQGQWEALLLRLENSTANILAQQEIAMVQSLQSLIRINASLSNVLHVIHETQTNVNSKLGWIVNAIVSFEAHLEVVCWHVLYMLLGMLIMSFIDAPRQTRILLMVLLPFNGAWAVQRGNALGFTHITLIIVLFTPAYSFVKALFFYCFASRRTENAQKSLGSTINQKGTSSVDPTSNTSENHKRDFEVKSDRDNCLVAGSESVISKSSVKSLKENRAAFNRPSTPYSRGTDESLAAEKQLDIQTTEEEASDEVPCKESCAPTSEDKQRDVQEWVRNVRDVSPSNMSRVSWRSGTPKSLCSARCKSGTLCRNPSTPGKSTCHRHSINSP